MSLNRMALSFAALLVAGVVQAQDRPWTGLGAATTDPFTVPAARPQPEPRRDIVLADPAGAPARGGVGSLIFPSPGPAANRPRPAAPAAVQKVDESALRFYATQNDTARVAAEIRRLRTLYPAWQPPGDLYDGPQSGDEEQKLWQLFSEERFEEIRQYVEEVRAANPDWRPSEEFIAKFRAAETRRALLSASDGKEWERVLAVAQTQPTMLACTDVDVLWRVAEALAQTSDRPKAFDLYRYILGNCRDRQERLATIQKASTLLDAQSMDRLIALGERRPDGSNEFDPVRLDILRGQIGAVAAGAVTTPIEPQRMKAFEDQARQKQNAGDGELAGWYRYSQKEFPAAAAWFRNVMAWKPSPKATEGLALTLREQGDIEQAEKLAYDGRADALLRKLYIELMAFQLTKPDVQALPAERVARLERVVDEAKSAQGAGALGWYTYNAGNIAAARTWFDKARTWGEDEDNVLGLALSENRLKNLAAFRDIVERYKDKYPEVAALRQYAVVEQSVQRRGRGPGGGGGNSRQVREALALYESGKYREALAAFERSGTRDYGLEVVKGWALYKSGDIAQARDHFTTLDRRRSTQQSREGQYYARQQLTPRRFSDDP